MERRGLAIPPRPAIASMTQALEDINLMTITEEFALAVRIMNSAAHGYDVDATAAEKAFSVGKRFLAEVRKLTGEL